MKKNERIEILKTNGVDTSKYFTILVNQDIPAGTKINIALEEDPVKRSIMEDGYVRNTKLYRRFVAAHYLKMLNSPEGWHGYLNKHYSYMYQFDMMFEEVRILSILENKDTEAFNERKRFFTPSIVKVIMLNYMDDVRKYIANLPVKHCKGKPYARINGFGDVFISNIVDEVTYPLVAEINSIRTKSTYKNLYKDLLSVKKKMITLPWETKKSKVWVDAFQAEGAFYTLKNLIMFHGVMLYYNDMFLPKYQSVEIIDQLAHTYEGYQFNGLLKATIKANNFDLKKSIEEHK